MQFNDGSEDVQPGDHIVLDNDDFGSATYDSDHDGVADSIIVGQGDESIVITDSDHDGEADSVTKYDADGNQIDPQTQGGGTDQSQPGEGDGPGIDQTSADTGASAGTGAQDGPAESGDQANGPADQGGASDTAVGGISVIGDDGTPMSVGEPTADLDGDGTPDTAVVRNEDGSTTGYTDIDGDGQAEQITQIGSDGSVVIAVTDGNGGWDVAATGHLDSDGTFVEDASPDGSATVDLPADGSGAGTQGALTAAGIESDAVTGLPGTTEIVFTAADGQTYELGAPTADLDGDGNPDTVVTEMPDGTVVGYSDVDGDGQADQVTQIDPDGSVTIGVPDGNGGWEQAATGRIGDHGEFVPDAAPQPGVSA